MPTQKAPAAQVEFAKKAAATKAAREAKSKLKVFDRVAARQARRARARRIARGKTSRADGDGDGDGDGDPDGGAIRLISKPEVLDRVGVTFPTIWKWMIAGKFPRSRELGGKIAWIEAEVEEWIASLPQRQYKGDEPRRRAGPGGEASS